VTVKFLPISYGSWDQQVNLMLASGEKLDLMVSGGANFGPQVAKNQLLPIDDLVAKYGSGIMKSMDPAYLAAGKMKGKLYAVPSVRDFASSLGVAMRKDILDKEKIDPKSIKTYDDLAAVLRKVAKAEPDLVPLAPGIESRSFVDFMYSWDSLSDGFGVLMNNGASLKVVDLYETPEYKALVKKLYGWSQEGILQKDATTNKDHCTSLVRAGKLFGFLTTMKPGIQAQETKECGMEMVTVGILPALATTSSVANVMWSVPRNSTAPDKAMQFLNLMYSDLDLVNLLDWGIEGKHYVKLDGGVIGYPAGVDATNTGYGLSMGWLFGNQLISHIWKGDSPTLFKELDAFNRSATRSKALGFTFDNSSVKTEVAAVTNALNRYKLAVECGAVDPDKALPDMVKDMKAAGLGKIIAEKQKQLDAWAAASK
jgi:putative aldouronate transport system substrate-binding protein